MTEIASTSTTIANVNMNKHSTNYCSVPSSLTAISFRALEGICNDGPPEATTARDDSLKRTKDNNYGQSAWQELTNWQ